jgi:hypothetical protein
MTPLSERRYAENEVAFREANHKIQDELDQISAQAQAEGHPFAEHESLQLHFYCECADEKCRERVVLSLRDYREAHANVSRFVLLPGHEVPEVERVVRREPTYMIVEKFVTPPGHAEKLNKTRLDKSDHK